MVAKPIERPELNEYSEPSRITSSLIALFRNHLPTVEALEETIWLSQKYGLQTADMPTLITAMHAEKAIHDAGRKKVDVNPNAVSARYMGERKNIDTITGEYSGWREGKLFYEVWHGFGSLSTPEGLQKGLEKNKELEQKIKTASESPTKESLTKQISEEGFLFISDEEWVNAGKGKYRGEDVIRVHVNDALEGNVPPPGTKYIIYACPEEDSFSDSPVLNYDMVSADKRLVMISGGPETLRQYEELTFNQESEGGEGFPTIKAYPPYLLSHGKNDSVTSNFPARGRLVRMMGKNKGLNGCNGRANTGRFAAINKDYLRGIVTGNGTGNFPETDPEKKAAPICAYYTETGSDGTDTSRAMFLGPTKKADGGGFFSTETPLETIVHGPLQNVPKTLRASIRDELDAVIQTYKR